MVRVVDFTRVLAGPCATQILGDQGFDVVKIESLEGDETRHFLPYREGESVYFACTNRNKRSIAIDLRRPEGRDVAARLIHGADVVVENFRPGVLDRLGLGYSVLAEQNPGLIYVSVSAFGPGPWAERAGYDLVLQAMGGIAALTGDPPVKAGPSIADLASAQVVVQAVLFALLERADTGRGKRVDVSMFDVQHSLLAYYASAWLNAATAPPAASNAHPSIAPYNLYRCNDGWLAICCANDSLWHKLRAAIGLHHIEWDTLAGRIAGRDRLDAEINAVLSVGTVAEWDARLVAAGVPCGPAWSVVESLSAPIARQLTIAGWTFPAPPLVPTVTAAPPRLGEHTIEILTELGLTRAEIAELRAIGVVSALDV